MKFGKIDRPEFVREDRRGVFKEMLTFGEWRSLITGSMKKGSEMGHHYHRHTIVYVLLLSGEAEIKTQNTMTQETKKDTLTSGQAYVFRPEENRVISYRSDSEFVLMKSHAYDSKNPDLIELRMEL
jgi:hypothetical protein